MLFTGIGESSAAMLMVTKSEEWNSGILKPIPTQNLATCNTRNTGKFNIYS